MIRRQLAAAFALVILLAACRGGDANVAAPTPEATLTLVPSTTPSNLRTSTYGRIPSGSTLDGYPVLGGDDAPIEMVEYGSYDSTASATSHDDIFTQMLPRIEAGEVQYVFVPLSGTGNLPNGVNAARGALCAGEQGAYWAFHDRLFALQSEGVDAFSGANLLNIVDELGLDRDAWNNCALGERPGAVLRQASEQALEEENYSGTPTILINGNYVLNDLVSINTIIDQMLARVDGGEVAALPTVDIEGTQNAPTPTPELELNATTGEAIDPPIDITLPEGWSAVLSDTQLVNDVDNTVRTIPFTLYKGPVEGGIGSIALLWGFPNFTSGDAFAVEMGVSTPTPNLRIDGSRLLRLAVVEQGCNIGTDLEREYRVGDFIGIGTEWSAVDCPELPDTRGWFVGVRQYNINFIFYVYIEPINPGGVTDAERAAREQIQAILDTITFQPLDATPTGE